MIIYFSEKKYNPLFTSRRKIDDQKAVKLMINLKELTIIP